MHGEVFIEPPNEELLQGVDRTTVRPQLVFGLVFFFLLCICLFLRNNSIQLVLPEASNSHAAFCSFYPNAEANGCCQEEFLILLKEEQ